MNSDNAAYPEWLKVLDARERAYDAAVRQADLEYAIAKKRGESGAAVNLLAAVRMAALVHIEGVSQ